MTEAKEIKTRDIIDPPKRLLKDDVKLYEIKSFTLKENWSEVLLDCVGVRVKDQVPYPELTWKRQKWSEMMNLCAERVYNGGKVTTKEDLEGIASVMPAGYPCSDQNENLPDAIDFLMRNIVNPGYVSLITNQPSTVVFSDRERDMFFPVDFESWSSSYGFDDRLLLDIGLSGDMVRIGANTYSCNISIEADPFYRSYLGNYLWYCLTLSFNLDLSNSQHPTYKFNYKPEIKIQFPSTDIFLDKAIDDNEPYLEMNVAIRGDAFSSYPYNPLNNNRYDSVFTKIFRDSFYDSYDWNPLFHGKMFLFAPFYFIGKYPPEESIANITIKNDILLENSQSDNEDMFKLIEVTPETYPQIIKNVGRKYQGRDLYKEYGPTICREFIYVIVRQRVGNPITIGDRICIDNPASSYFVDRVRLYYGVSLFDIPKAAGPAKAYACLVAIHHESY